jgi:hypothetical protein
MLKPVPLYVCRVTAGVGFDLLAVEPPQAASIMTSTHALKASEAKRVTRFQQGSISESYPSYSQKYAAHFTHNISQRDIQS